MVDLDDRETVLRLQGGDAVIRSVDSLPDQLQQSFHESYKIGFPEEYKKVKRVVVCGMGGSRFPSLILQDLFKEQLKIPYIINDNYTLPGFVSKDTLVVLSSYSGTTEEVLACQETALSKGAKLTGVTSGGEVAAFLKKHGAPAYVFNPVHNPSGQPRIGFGYAVGGHLGILMKLGFVDAPIEAVEQALQNAPSLLENFKLDVREGKNPAKQLAKKLYGRYPYYVVSEFLTGVGNAVSNQTNETAKAISSYRVIPELNHHLMEGLKHPNKLREIATFVFFYSTLYSQPIQKRFTITKEVVEQNKIQTIWHELSGKSTIEQVFELMGLGSYLTLYLSTLYEENPQAVPYVDYFKKKLQEK